MPLARGHTARKWQTQDEGCEAMLPSLASCLEGPVLGPGNAGWPGPAGTPPRCPGRLLGSACIAYPVSWEQRQGSGCVHTGEGAGVWEEPAARPQMVALPTSATSLPSSRRGSVEKVGEAGVPCARLRLRGGCLCEFCVRGLCGAGG